METEEGEASFVSVVPSKKRGTHSILRKLCTIPQVPEFSFGIRLAFSALVSLCFAASLVLLTPLKLLISDKGSIILGLSSVLPALIVATIVLTALATAFLMRLTGRKWCVGLGAIGALTVAMKLQTLVLNSDFAIAHYTQTFSATSQVVSALAWVGVIAVAVSVAVRFPKGVRWISLGLCVVCVSVSIAGLAKESSNKESVLQTNDMAMTQEGLLSLSDGSNVVVFCLDTYDTVYLKSAFADEPSLKEPLTGFTWYTDSAGSAIPTRLGVPYLLTGVMPQLGQTYTTFFSNRYNDSTFLDDISAAGYDIGIYTDSLGLEFTWKSKADLTLNLHEKSSLQVDTLAALGVMVRASLYRVLPQSLKPLAACTIDDINAVVGNSNIDYERKSFVLDDAAFGSLIQTQGLTISSVGSGDTGTAGSFRFIHMLGVHWPYTLTADGVAAGYNTTLLEASEGSLKIVEDYLQQMKQAGIYDSSTIIITADHGFWEDTIETCEHASSPILLVKPAQSSEEASAPLKIVTDVPTGHIDYPATVIKAIGGNYEAYGTPVDEVPAGISRTRQYFYLKHNSPLNLDIELQEYLIDGDATNFSNYTRTYNVIPNDDKLLHP